MPAAADHHMLWRREPGKSYLTFTAACGGASAEVSDTERECSGSSGALPALTPRGHHSNSPSCEPRPNAECIHAYYAAAAAGNVRMPAVYYCRPQTRTGHDGRYCEEEEVNSVRQSSRGRNAKSVKWDASATSNRIGGRSASSRSRSHNTHSYSYNNSKYPRGVSRERLEPVLHKDMKSSFGPSAIR